jgi:hypothetical protein
VAARGEVQFRFCCSRVADLKDGFFVIGGKKGKREDFVLSIRMAGIDYEKAPVEVRELFSMTRAAPPFAGTAGSADA